MARAIRFPGTGRRQLRLRDQPAQRIAERGVFETVGPTGYLQFTAMKPNIVRGEGSELVAQITLPGTATIDERTTAMELLLDVLDRVDRLGIVVDLPAKAPDAAGGMRGGSAPGVAPSGQRKSRRGNASA